jgi:peptidoglycan/LPS O-acetylase OafA/YrhL
LTQSGVPASYRPDIDGLRCIAITVVVLFHVGVPFLSGGFVGVDVFFVISGYLIGAHVYRETRPGSFSLRRFYERRAKRILPAFFFVLAATYVLGCLLLSASALRGLAAQTISAIASCSNLYFWLREGYFAPKADTNPLLMTWSLGVEEQFYLFFPLLMMLLRRLVPRHLIACLSVLSIASFVIAIYGVSRNPTAAFYLLPTRAWEIGVGCILGIFEVEYPKNSKLQGRSVFTELLGLCGLVVLLGTCFLYKPETPFPGVAALLPVGAAIALIRSRESRINIWLLSAKPMVAIGLVSYSWYLWHWPLLSFAHIATGGPLSVPMGCFIVAVALLLSVLSYFVIERPFRRTKKTGPRFLASYGIACVAFAVPALILFWAHGWPSRFPHVLSIEAAVKQGYPDPCLASYGSKKPTGVPICIPQESNEERGLALLGDSHASSLASELRNRSKENGNIFYEFTKSSCPQLGTVTRTMLSHPSHAQECAAYNKEALDQVLSNPRIHTVILAGYWSAAFPLHAGYGYVHVGEEANGTMEQNWTNFRMGLEETIRRLQEGNKKIVIATDVPRFSVDPFSLTIGQAIPLRKFLGGLLTRGKLRAGVEPESATISAEDVQANRIISQVSKATGASVLDLSAALCDGDFCTYALGGESLYVDEQHLSLLGAHVALENSADLFER